MTDALNDGGNAFPADNTANTNGTMGMTLRDWFAGQALHNPAICTGAASEYDIVAWFGPSKYGIEKSEIVAKQAFEYADALLEEREGNL